MYQHPTILWTQQLRAGRSRRHVGSNCERVADWSADFFDVGRYPTITFRSTRVTALPDETWEVVGDLTVRDTTRSVRPKRS
jgi:polyisoprenoid-binding protein YceI